MFCWGIFSFSEGILYIPFCSKFRQGFRQSGGIEDSGPKTIESEVGSVPVAITAVSCDWCFWSWIFSTANLPATSHWHITRNDAISDALRHPTFISQYGYKRTSALFHLYIIHYNHLLLLTPLLPLRAQHQGPWSYISFHPSDVSTVFDQIPTSSNRVPSRTAFPHHGGEVLS
jgi:hypothetical protein